MPAEYKYHHIDTRARFDNWFRDVLKVAHDRGIRTLDNDQEYMFECWCSFDPTPESIVEDEINLILELS